MLGKIFVLCDGDGLKWVMEDGYYSSLAFLPHIPSIWCIFVVKNCSRNVNTEVLFISPWRGFVLQYLRGPAERDNPCGVHVHRWLPHHWLHGGRQVEAVPCLTTVLASHKITCTLLTYLLISFGISTEFYPSHTFVWGTYCCILICFYRRSYE